MSKIQVYKLAEQHKMTNEALVSLLQGNGVTSVKNKMSTVELDVADRILKRHFEKQRAPEVVEERIRPTVVKRKAKEAPPEPPAPPPAAAKPEPSDIAHTRHPIPPARTSQPGERGVLSRTAAPLPARPVSAAPPEPVVKKVEAPPPVQALKPEAVEMVPKPEKADKPEPKKAVETVGAEVPAVSPAAKPVPKEAAAEPKREELEAKEPKEAKEGKEGKEAKEVKEPKPLEEAPAAAKPAAVAPPVETKRVEELPPPVKEAKAPTPAEAGAQAPVEAAKPAAKEDKAPAPAAAAVEEAPMTTVPKTMPEPGLALEAKPPAVEAVPPKEGAPPAEAKEVKAVKEAKPSEAKHQESAKPHAKEAPRQHGEAKPHPHKKGEGDKAHHPEKKGDGKHGQPEKKGEKRGEPHGEKKGEGHAQPSTVVRRQAGKGHPGSQGKPSQPPSELSSSRAGGPLSRPPLSESRPSSGEDKRPSSAPPAAPKTGIDVWQGRPGVPMPAARTGAPPARRTTYDPRANAQPARPGTPGGFGSASRQVQQRGRPGFAKGGMKGAPPPSGPLSRKPTGASTQEMASHKKVIKIEEQVSLQQLAAKMSVKATDVLMRLLSMGMTGVNINSTLDADTAKILASDFGWTVEDVAVSEADTLTAAMSGGEIEAGVEYQLRPPIVTVMGHVDHGKTSLLDRIRKASVAEGEAGGITQHIGAYRVETPHGTIAFLDTPGHEAFTAMRARGASLTDIVILVVAADDGVMPQTREAIAHAQAAKVPIVVAINKIDKPGADPEKITRDLSSLGLQPEEWGGTTMFCRVSAKQGLGIDELLESVLLQAEVLELKASQKRRASGTVIEALLDRGRGPVARVMVQDGTLRTGDILLAGSAWGKVRAMTDELGRQVGEAGPATPVEVLGLNEVPSAGDPVHAVKDAKTAEEIAEGRRKKASRTLIPQDSRVSLETLTTRLAETEQLELKLIIKGDVQGSVEAVGHALTKLSTPKVKVTVVHAGVGGITEGDVNLAVASKAIIVGFNVRPTGKAAGLAEGEGVEIRLYNIIYNAVDDIKAAMEGLLPATKVEKLLGRAEVRQVFRVQKVGTVAGCMVIHGTMKRTADARLVRDSMVVWTGRLSGLRRFKDDAKEVSEGLECGISLDGYQDIKENDIVESFEIEEVKTKLS